MSNDSPIPGQVRRSARALASQRNGASSRGPKSAAGKARAARNALKHGLRARRMVLLDDEDAAEFAAFAAALRAELAPEGVLQADPVARIVSAAWRAHRADRLEATLLDRHLAPARPDGAGAASGVEADPQAALGARLIRDGNGPRVLETLLRYRGAAQGELFRALGALRVFQAEARALAAAGPAGTRAHTCLLPPPGRAVARGVDQTNPRNRILSRL